MSQDALPPSLAEKLKRGALFEGKYRLVRAIGQGAFASVIHARHEAMDRDVALKVLKPDVIEDHPDVGQRFLTESRLASRLSSSHTVMIYDFGETSEGIPYMVLEYVDGRPLDYVIEKYDGLGLKRSIRVTLQILESLQEAHSHNIIHRDLKPANVMVGKGGKRDRDGVHVKVLDFGVAKLVEGTESGVELDVDETGRRSTQFIGTPRYMSPEQILGREVRPASDLYSLGLIFFEMCTGNDAVASDNVARVAQTHLSEEPLEFPGLEQLPQVLQKVVLKATARQPEDRFQSAEQFQQALEEALEQGRSRSQRARQVPAEAKTEQGRRRQRRSERTSEVFSGEGYVAPPEEEEIEKSGSAAGSRTSTPPRPGAKRNCRRSPSPAPTRSTSTRDNSSSSGELELDMDSVEKQKRQVERKQRYGNSREEFARRAAAAADGAQWYHWAGSLTAIVVLSYVGFVIVAGATGAMGSATRSVMGLLPGGLALLWAVFSENAYRDVVRGTLVPWARRSVTTVLLSLVVLAVTMPAPAVESLQTDGLWFIEALPAGLQLGWVVGGTEAICTAAATIVEAVGSLLPWGN